MPKPFYHEQSVVVDGETLRLVINFAALDATESLLHPRNYADILDELGSGAAPKSLEAKVVWGLLREHHPALGLDEATSLIFGETGIMVGVAVSKLLEAAFPEADPKAKAKGKNPPKRRGASKTS